MPTLILMRHAKSSWTTGEADHRRPLSGRGVRDATAAGALLADFPIDRVLSSSSTRTRQTWARAEAGGARCSDVTFTDELYGAWTDTVIDLLRELDGSVGTALVLGHEPTMSSVIEVLLSRPSWPTRPPDDSSPARWRSWTCPARGPDWPTAAPGWCASRCPAAEAQRVVRPSPICR